MRLAFCLTANCTFLNYHENEDKELFRNVVTPHTYQSPRCLIIRKFPTVLRYSAKMCGHTKKHFRGKYQKCKKCVFRVRFSVTLSCVEENEAVYST